MKDNGRVEIMDKDTKEKIFTVTIGVYFTLYLIVALVCASS